MCRPISAAQAVGNLLPAYNGRTELPAHLFRLPASPFHNRLSGAFRRGPQIRRPNTGESGRCAGGKEEDFGRGRRGSRRKGKRFLFLARGRGRRESQEVQSHGL